MVEERRDRCARLRVETDAGLGYSGGGMALRHTC
jgi:hypothetical protein